MATAGNPALPLPGEGKGMAKRAAEPAETTVSVDPLIGVLSWAAKRGAIIYGITIFALLMWQVLVPTWERYSLAVLKVREAEIAEKMANAEATKQNTEAIRQMVSGMSNMSDDVRAQRLSIESLVNELKTHFRAALAEDPQKVAGND